MDKDELKAIQEVLSNKKKFKRVLVILGMVLFTVTVIAIAGFYLKAIVIGG